MCGWLVGCSRTLDNLHDLHGNYSININRNKININISKNQDQCVSQREL